MLDKSWNVDENAIGFLKTYVYMFGGTHVYCPHNKFGGVVIQDNPVLAVQGHIEGFIEIRTHNNHRNCHFALLAWQQRN